MGERAASELDRGMHLVVLQHGLFGSPLDMRFVEEELLRCTERERVVVLNTGVNAGSGTYDGVDVAGDRLAAEVQRFCQEAERQVAGKRVTHVSFIGYSLGGLIVRYALGKLAATGFFKLPPAPPSPATGGASSAGVRSAPGAAAPPASVMQRQDIPSSSAVGLQTHVAPPSSRPLAGPFSPLQHRRRQRSAPQLAAPQAPPPAPAVLRARAPAATVAAPHSQPEHAAPNSCSGAAAPSSPGARRSGGGARPAPGPAAEAGAREEAEGGGATRQLVGAGGRGRGEGGVVLANVVTFASPHLGCWQPAQGSLYRRAYNAVLPYTLSRTGSQLVLADGYLSPSRRAPAHLRAARRTPLLAVMSDPTYAFHGALALAQKRVVLANVRHDATVPFLTSSIALGNPFLLDPGRPISSRYPCIVVPCSPPRGPGSAARADAAAAGSRRDLASPGGAPRLPSPPKQQRQHHQQRRLAPSLRLFVSATASASDAAPAPIQPLVPTTTTGQPAQTRTRGLALLLLLLAARSRGHGARNGAEEPAHSRSLVRRIASLVVGWPTLLMRAAGQPQRQRQLAPPPAPSSQPSCAASVSARRAAHAAPTPALRIRGGATGAAPRSCSAARAHGTRLRGDVFACTLPIMLLLFHVMLLWLFVQSATHYLLLLTCQVRRDQSWDARWPAPPPSHHACSAAAGDGGRLASPPPHLEGSAPSETPAPDGPQVPTAAGGGPLTPALLKRAAPPTLAGPRSAHGGPPTQPHAAAAAEAALPGAGAEEAWRRVARQGLDWLALARECAQPSEPWELARACYELSLSLLAWCGALWALLRALAREGAARAWRGGAPASGAGTLAGQGGEGERPALAAAEGTVGVEEGGAVGRSAAGTAAEEAGEGAVVVQGGQEKVEEEEERARLVRRMCEQLSLLAWQRVAVDTRHYHAHAAVVVRSAVRFAATHGHVVEFALRQMRDG